MTRNKTTTAGARTQYSKKLKIVTTSHHRNGISGNPFDVTIFEQDGQRYIAFDFANEGGFGVVDLDKAAAGDIAFGSNSWRGDRFEGPVRKAASKVEDS